MPEIPDWPPGTVAILATAGESPHAIPVSTAVRAGPSEVRFALAPRRESLARLRQDPRCALTILAEDVAVTLHGRATVTGEVAGVVAIRLEVHELQDHDQPTFRVDAGVSWRWTDADAERRDAEVRAALAIL